MKRGILLLGMKDILLYHRTETRARDTSESSCFCERYISGKNEIVLAPLQSLEKTEMWLDNWNLINENRVLGCSDIIVKIRYRKQENHGTVTVTPEHLLHIQLHEPLTAIAPGQAAAFYKDDLLLGGGIIVKAR